MRLEFSPYIAFQVKDYERAVEFYREVMGMDLVQVGETEAELKSGPITLYVEPDDLASAKVALQKAGCGLEATTTPEGHESCFVYDPFEMIFHLWQEQT